MEIIPSINDASAKEIITKPEININKIRKRKANTSIKDIYFPEESQIKEKINELYSYLESNKEDFNNLNEKFFKDAFKNIFNKNNIINNNEQMNIISHYENIYEYFNMNQETLIPASNEINKKFILNKPNFWILWIEFLALTFKIRNKLNSTANRKSNNSINSLNNTKNVCGEDNKNREEFFQKFEIIFNNFDEAFSQVSEYEKLHSYYQNFLKSIPLENIFLLEKKFKKKSEGIDNEKCLYLNFNSNNIINKLEKGELNDLNKSFYNQDLLSDADNDSFSSEENLTKITKNKKMEDLNYKKNQNANNKKFKISSDRKSTLGRKPFSNIYKNFLKEFIENEENEIINENEFKLVEGINLRGIDLPDLKEFDYYSKQKQILPGKNPHKRIKVFYINFFI